MKSRYIILIIVVVSIVLIVYGFVLQAEKIGDGNEFIGLGTVGLFLVAMPLFLFTESKGKSMKNYMLTQENLKKMQEKEKEINIKR